jgi:hypothetical protein
VLGLDQCNLALTTVLFSLRRTGEPCRSSFE